jgi:hypothetical protein
MRVCTDESFWANLWAQGFSQMLRVGVFGDSTHTSPGGSGQAFMANLLLAFHQMYGNTPGTHLCCGNGMGNGIAQDAAIAGDPALKNATNGFASSNGLLPPGAMYPADDGVAGPRMLRWLADLGAGNGSGHYLYLYPWMWDFNRTGYYTPATNPTNDSLRWGSGPLMDISQGVTVEAVMMNGSADVRANALRVWGYSSAGKGGSFGTYAKITGEWSIASPGAADGAFVRASTTTPIYSAGAASYMLRMSSGQVNKYIGYVGSRVITANPAKRFGVLLDSYSEGGAQSNTYIATGATCAAAGPALAAIGCDIAILAYGANDSAATCSPDDFKARLLANIAWLRAAVPNIPIVIMNQGWALSYATAYNYPADPTFAAAWAECADFYPAVAQEIAAADSRVMAVNTLRGAIQNGMNWLDGDPEVRPYGAVGTAVPRSIHGMSRYIADTVHWEASSEASNGAWSISYDSDTDTTLVTATTAIFKPCMIGEMLRVHDTASGTPYHEVSEHVICGISAENGTTGIFTAARVTGQIATATGRKITVAVVKEGARLMPRLLAQTMLASPASGTAQQIATDQAGAPAAKRMADTTIGGVAGTLPPPTQRLSIGL